MNYLAVGPNCWGKGDTIAKAVANAKQHWPTGFHRVKRPTKEHFSIFECEEPMTVDDFGRILSMGEIKKIQTSSLAVKD